MTKNSKGVVYVAFGELYTAKALFSMKTLRKTNNNLPVMIITNLDLDLSGLDFWNPDIDILKIVDADTQKNRSIKTNIYEHVPFQSTAYIDADTYILKSLDDIWKSLDYFDIAFKLNATRQKTVGKGDQLVLNSSTYVKDIPIHFNGGMFFFRKTKAAKDFFKRWSDTFEAGKISYDQISLIDAIFNCSARVLPLTQEWNFFPDWRFYAGKVKAPYILHYSNRISYALEHELIQIAEALNFDIATMKDQIAAKRLARKAKIGRRHWWRMLFYWRFFPQIEKQRWNS